MRANGNKNYCSHENTPAQIVRQKVKTAEKVYSEKNRVTTAEQMNPKANYVSNVTGAAFSGISQNVISSATVLNNTPRKLNVQNNNNGNQAVDFNKLNKKKNHIHESPE